jgi:hypothetical protein
MSRCRASNPALVVDGATGGGLAARDGGGDGTRRRSRIGLFGPRLKSDFGEGFRGALLEHFNFYRVKCFQNPLNIIIQCAK